MYICHDLKYIGLVFEKGTKNFKNDNPCRCRRRCRYVVERFRDFMNDSRCRFVVLSLSLSLSFYLILDKIEVHD